MKLLKISLIFGLFVAFSAYAQASDETLVLSLSSETPIAQQIIASEGVDRDEIERLELMSFNMQADMGDISVNQIGINICKKGNKSRTTAETVYLYQNGFEIAHAPVIYSCDYNQPVVFDGLNLKINENEIRPFRVYVKIINSDNEESDWLAGISGQNVSATNSLGEPVAVSGEFFSDETIRVLDQGPQITLVAKSVVTNGVPQSSGSGNVTTSMLIAEFLVKFSAVDSPVRIKIPDSRNSLFNQSTFRVYVNDTVYEAANSAAGVKWEVPEGYEIENNSFIIQDGEVAVIPVRFILSGRFANGTPLMSGLYAVGLEKLRWSYPGEDIITSSFMSFHRSWRTNFVMFP